MIPDKRFSKDTVTIWCSGWRRTQFSNHVKVQYTHVYQIHLAVKWTYACTCLSHIFTQIFHIAHLVLSVHGDDGFHKHEHNSTCFQLPPLKTHTPIAQESRHTEGNSWQTNLPMTVNRRHVSFMQDYMCVYDSTPAHYGRSWNLWLLQPLMQCPTILALMQCSTTRLKCIFILLL